MADGFHLTVLTPERMVLEQDVYSIVAPGSAGYLGVLRNHAPLITTLVPGKLTVKDLGQKPTVYAIGGGFLEVSRNHVTILADTLESPEEIDLDDALRNRDLAEKRLRGAHEGPDRDLAQDLLDRSLNRIRVKRDPSPSV
jgi:F-type H+-transporting ATPase subunit epsilon